MYGTFYTPWSLLDVEGPYGVCSLVKWHLTLKTTSLVFRGKRSTDREVWWGGSRCGRFLCFECGSVLHNSSFFSLSYSISIYQLRYNSAVLHLLSYQNTVLMDICVCQCMKQWIVFMGRLGAAHDILIKWFIIELDTSVGLGLTSEAKGQLWLFYVFFSHSYNYS